jgi:hypothetical protein
MLVVSKDGRFRAEVRETHNGTEVTITRRDERRSSGGVAVYKHTHVGVWVLDCTFHIALDEVANLVDAMSKLTTVVNTQPKE